MKYARLLILSLFKRAFLFIAWVFGYSVFGINLIRTIVLPFYLLVKLPSWKKDITFCSYIFPKQNRFLLGLRYYSKCIDKTLWTILIYDAWNGVLKHNDFSALEGADANSAENQNGIFLGMHYGPFCLGYLFFAMGMKPAILADKGNIPSLKKSKLSRILTKEYTFRAEYSGMCAANASERSFIEKILSGSQGILLQDIPWVKNNFVQCAFLGKYYPIGIFPFKLSLRNRLKVSVIWLSKISGKGYLLNVKEIHFDSVDEGAQKYCAVLEEVIRDDPFLWHFGKYFLERSNTHNPEKI